MWQYDEAKTLSYLAKKIDRTAKELAKDRAGKTSEEPTPNGDYRLQTFGIQFHGSS